MRSRPSLVARYAVSIFAIALATMFRILTIPIVGDGVPFILYYPTIVICAWFGGLWPGIFATLISSIIAWYAFFPPYYSFTVSDPTALDKLILFSLAGVLISLLAESLHRSKRTNLDIGQRERAERERFHVTLASIGDGVIAADSQGQVRFINQVATSLTGWKSEEAMGLALEEVFKIVNEETRLEVSNPALRAMKEGLIVGPANHTILIAKNGTQMPIDDSGAPIKDSEGNIIGAVLIFRDISEHRKSDEERAQLLQREQAARSEAEAANHMKDEFLATVSHELRAPLNAILGWIQFLRTGALNAAGTTKAIETIEQSVRMQSRLIDDLLDVTRITSGKLQLNFESVDLARVIESSLEAQRPAAQLKSIQMDSKLDGAGLSVLADSTRLQQVVSNLLSNAMKFTPNGGRVEVILERFDSTAQIHVRDTGRGISQELLPHLFERFRQGEDTKKYGGLGLGLAIVRHLVEMHGGSVEAQSPGENLGSTFTVRLPAEIVLKQS